MKYIASLQRSLYGTTWSKLHDCRPEYPGFDIYISVVQVEMGSMMDSFLAKQEELVEEIKALRRENQQLRDLY